MLTSELIERGAKRFADRTAVLFGERSMTFAEVNSLANRLGRVLSNQLGDDDERHVGLLFNNSLYSPSLDFACVKARITRVPLNARLSALEHAEMLRGLGVKSLVYGPDLAERAGELKTALPDLELYGLGSDVFGPDLMILALDEPDSPPAGEPQPDDVILALYTSGTTGQLKAVEHTQSSYAAIVHNILNNLVDPEEGDVMLHAASMIHASGTFVLPFWCRGGASAILPSFTPATYVEAIRRWRPTTLNLVPTMIGMLLDHPGAPVDAFASVQTIIYGASPMPAPLMERSLDFFGPRLVQYYGQTEAPLCITVLSKADHAAQLAHRRLACGFPAVDCEVKLVGEDGRPVPVGDAGEIVVRAPFMMKGYRNAPELNAEHFLPGGWLRTRDVGRFDADGCLYLVDRVSEMIVTGGYNVYPREVEDVLCAHPAVREAAVVGLPDDKWGEVVTGFVVLRAEMEVDETALIEFVRERIAAYKAPKGIRYIADIPKSAVGKPLRRAIRDPFWEGRDRRI